MIRFKPDLWCSRDARRLARRHLPRMMFDFIDGAAGTEAGKVQNRRALQKVKLQPVVLRNVEEIAMNTNLLGTDWSLPFGFAPMGMCALAWPGADDYLAQQSRKRNIPHCVSTASSTTMEELNQQTAGRSWFQLYTGTSPEATEELIARAEASGIDTLILTVDTPRLSRRIRDLHNGFQVPFKMGPKQILDFALHPRWSVETLLKGVPEPMHFATSKLGKKFNRSDSRGATDWAFLDHLRNRWKGKLIIKGVMAADDALRIRNAGCDAVYVSNHGGRQLDSAPAAIEALPKIREIVGPDYPLIFDSGIRSGEDVVRALALGATFVMLGRPLLFAIGGGGQTGLQQLLDGIVDDLKVAMAQTGCTSIDQINHTILA